MILETTTGTKAASVTLELIGARQAVVGVIGLGYVGLPLAAAAAEAGFCTIGFDIDTAKIPLLNAGQSYVDAVASAKLTALVKRSLFSATDNFDRLADCDVIVICVPTPLTAHREPDMSYIEETARTISRRLRRAHLVILESTTYPGTTRNVVVPLLEKSGLRSEEDFFVGFSPEREDPGNATFDTRNIPKVVSGEGADAVRLVEAFYGAVVAEIVSVRDTATAEAVKITENVFRATNIALANELKVIFDAMGINVWEVIDAAKTKPFGFMPFYPGPGLGGHCIPIDPFYLTWRAREFGVSTRFIELAGEVNTAMPRYVVERAAEALDRIHGKALSRSKVLILGLAYKRNVSDIRESPALRIMELLIERGAKFSFHDPRVEAVPPTREHARLTGIVGTQLTPEIIADHDAIIIVTDHDGVNYAMVAEHAALVVDTRNAMARLGLRPKALVLA